MDLSTDTPELPMDLVTEVILTRLPAKALLRCRAGLEGCKRVQNNFEPVLVRCMCVSKLWLSLIRSRYFNNRFLGVPSPRLYMCIWNQAYYNDYSETLTFAPTDTRTDPSDFIVDHDLTNPRHGSYILQNLGGFMFYVYWRKPRIYNPATLQLVTLPFRKSDHVVVPPGGRQIVNYYLGYDPVSDKYKMLSLISVYFKESRQVISSENWVFVLKPRRGGSWKKAALTPTDFCPHVSFKGGLSIDGVIYYMALIAPNEIVVVSFDIRSEAFNMIQLPELHERSDDVTLLEYGGKAALFDPSNLRFKGVVALWTVEDVGSKKWSCKSLVLQPSQLHLVNSITFGVCVASQTGKVVLVPEIFLPPFYILSYDLQSNDMRKIEIRGIPDRWFNMGEEHDVQFDVMFMDQSESLVYSDFLSSLVWIDIDNQVSSSEKEKKNKRDNQATGPDKEKAL